MTEFWSGWVILLSVFTLGASLFLFIYGLRVDIPTQPDGTSGHVWAHGVLREGVRSLPVWWIVISAIGFVAAFGYLALYPGFGAYKGVLGWTAHDELARDQAANRQLEAPLRERVRGKTVESIATDPEALRAGGMLFVENCAACHGRNARGNVALGAPDLTDGDWLYGGDGKAILTSILDGRRGAMPAFAGTLPDDSILDIAHYVASLSGIAERLLARAARQAALLQLRAVPRRRRQGQPGARRAEPHRCRVALRRRARREPSPRPSVAAATA